LLAGVWLVDAGGTAHRTKDKAPRAISKIRIEFFLRMKTFSKSIIAHVGDKAQKMNWAEQAPPPFEAGVLEPD
jgi:hypothetical protein